MPVFTGRKNRFTNLDGHESEINFATPGHTGNRPQPLPISRRPNTPGNRSQCQDKPPKRCNKCASTFGAVHGSRMQVQTAKNGPDGASTPCPTTKSIKALIVGIGFWVYHTITMIRNPQKSIGNYLGPYIKLKP